MINLSPRCCVLNSPKCSAPILSEIVNESCRHCDQRTQKLINNFCGQSLFRVVRCPLNGVKPGFRDQEKVSLSPE